jgi:tetratricopeptide (TPR) repeat protein
MKSAIRRSAAVLALTLAAAPLFAAAPVKEWEEKVTIPTYLIGQPDPNPQFYFGGNSQGAQHRIYPYPAYDNLTTQKKDKTYTMVFLENEYIKIGILPELGGKIFEAIDKTDNYDFIYHQHVIKPALISLLGAWISGGIEWDIPHHHRATSFLPMQYKVEENPDGSKTVWIGELELRDRMEWTVGVTVRPGSSCFEAAFRILNRTPVPTSMLSFSNVAVSVDDTYQVIYPPSTQFVTYHGKVDFTTWPIATTKFNRADFTSGVDVSWYKNHPTANSMFAWNYQDDFLAGYDHGRNVGIMSIADHNIVPGKKFWTWGDGPVGHQEDHLLTDSDGPYIELMVGAYSDNQPDYSWLQPYETRTWSQFWYPFRDIDGAKNATTEAAVNLEVKDGKATIGFYSTKALPSATVSLKLKDQVLLSEKIAISPAHSFVKVIDLPAGADEHDLRASIEANGRELVAYSPIRLEKQPMPSTVKPPPAPSAIKTNEELYLIGLRMEQFHAPGAADPDAYWQEALRRDSGDIRVNTALGIDAIKAGRFADAEKCLRKALERDEANYTSPKDGEPIYYLGLALKAQGKLDEASAQLYKSTWSAAWRSPGYFALAEIAATRGDFDSALTYDQHALEANTLNVRALALRSALLRHTGHNDQALSQIAALNQIDPLDVQGMAEKWLASPSQSTGAPFLSNTTQFPATALEVAADYTNAGLWQDGTKVLTHLIASSPDKSTVSPLVYYYLAYFADQLHQPEKARDYDLLAAKASPDFVFPFQMEMIAVLNDAMRVNPSDARAPYYLGNLLFDGQPQQAQALWEKSASLGADFPVVYRNLALVYTRAGNRDKALAALEKGVQAGGNAMVLNDLDQIYEQNGVTPAKRLAVLESHQSVVNRDDIIAREVNLDIFAGKPDSAIQLLESRFFRPWEGGATFSLGDSWINANLTRGHQQMAAKQYAAALASYQAALHIPDNLDEATGNIAGRSHEIQYWIGSAYEALGDSAKARSAWTEAATPPPSDATNAAKDAAYSGHFTNGSLGGISAGVRVEQAATFYQARALEKLGQPDRAKALYTTLVDTGEKELRSALTASPENQRTQAADSHFLIGLGQAGLNHPDQARQQFTLALTVSPDHFAAMQALNQLTLASSTTDRQSSSR